jgi:S1-C subfamily serine protease
MHHIDPADRPITRGERCQLAATLALILATALASGSSGCEFVPARIAASDRPATRTDAARATFKVYARESLAPHADAPASSRKPTRTDSWTGTAWVAESGSRSILVTAGHVCETRKRLTTNPDDIERMIGVVPEDLDVLSVEYQLEAADGSVTSAEVVADDDSVDLCALAVDHLLAPALPVADRDPAYGDRGFYVGAPRGLWGSGLAGIYEVTYAGRAHLFRGQCDGDMRAMCDAEGEWFSSAQAAPGASGSAAVVGGRVVGVINVLPTQFPTLTSSVPWDVIRAFLARVG